MFKFMMDHPDAVIVIEAMICFGLIASVVTWVRSAGDR